MVTPFFKILPRFSLNEFWSDVWPNCMTNCMTKVPQLRPSPKIGQDWWWILTRTCHEYSLFIFLDWHYFCLHLSVANFPRSLIVFDGSIFHVTWKFHNNDWLLSSDFAKRLYYDLLLKYKARYGIEIHSYCLMDNHPHLSGRCQTQKLFSDFFRVVNSCFAKRLNKSLKRKGQAVMDRFKSPTMQTDEDLMNVMIYNDLNPSRTIKGQHPKQHRWSSYHHYALGKKDPLLTEPECYLDLGRNHLERQRKYQTMIDDIFKDDSRVPRCPYRSSKGSMVCFIGNPHWVKLHHDKLRHTVQKSRRDWQERYSQFLDQSLNWNWEK